MREEGSAVGAYGSISPGYDPGYLLRESSKGAEGYYLSAVDEIGEPPGVWTGRACAELGLAPGSEVEPAVMEALYGELLDPRDPGFLDPAVLDEEKARLGSAPRQYKTAGQILRARLEAEPDALPERVEQLAIEARKQARGALLFLDFTFSVDKSTSVLHASLQAAALRAERAGDADQAAHLARMAEVVEDAIGAGSAAAIDYLQDEAGYSRAGYHGAIPKDELGRPLAGHATGRYVDAHEWVVASFLQHTSRDGDPQLHVHNAILNRVPCEDGTWRTIDSRGVHKARAAASAVGGRVMDEHIARNLGAAYAQRPDGHGRELTGVPQPVKDRFSSRRVAITAGVAELAAQYQARHGRAPSARALFSMGQYVTLDSRRAKPRHEHAVPRGVTLAGWEAEMRAAELGALADIPGRVIGSLDPETAPGISALGEAELRRVTQAAVADVQAARAVWGRSQLLAAIDAQLPGWLGGLDAAGVRAVLDELTDSALSSGGGYGVVSLEAPELAETPPALRRADGRSVYSPHDRALFTTRPHLDAEEQLLAAGGGRGGPAAGPDQAAAALGGTVAEMEALPDRTPAPAASGAAAAHKQPAAAAAGRVFADGLRGDQAAAVYGILTSGRPVDILIGPAGTGKSRTMGTLAALWEEQLGGTVVGVSTSENAAQVLAAEGVGTTYNIARFLARAGRGLATLSAGDLLIVDEAGMVDTAQLTALHQLAAAAGAKVLLTGDPAQLPAVGAGGALGMLARQHGYYQLTIVQRMTEAWEREASLRLRDGDITVLADYDRHGRLTEGSAEDMGTAAYRAWLADHLSGKDSLLIARDNEQAADLAGQARADLVAAGRVEPDGIALRDGNTGGVGDLVQARRNERNIRDSDGRWVANRDVWRIEGYQEDPYRDDINVIVRRDLGRDPATGDRQWSAPFRVPEKYIKEDTVLAYATTVHAAQGRTVDTCHALIDEFLSRALVYVALSRGREANYAYAITDSERHGADLRPGTGPAGPLSTSRPGEDAQDSDEAPAVSGRPELRAPWSPAADRFTVLVAALEREEADVPALDVLRDDLARSGHLAHLGAIWADLVAEESGRRYDSALRALLSDAQYQKYAAEEARSTLHRLVRSAELAGHDPDALLARAVSLRSLDNAPGLGKADDIARVLHSRVKDIAGDPVPRPASYAERTPQAADPQTGQYLRALATLMDDHTAALGDRAAAGPPGWALDHLGPVPADPLQRAEWSRRAGVVAAYREHYSPSDQHDVISREPAAPEARADWHAAYAALGRPAAQRTVAAAAAGELWARRARYERELAWAPPHVGQDLRQAALARREHATEAALAGARAQAATGQHRDELLARAQASEQLAASLAARERVLSGIDAQRARWHEATTAAREDAAEASAELRRRFPDAGRLSLRGQQEPQERQEAEPAREDIPGQHELGLGLLSDEQREAAGQELRHAAETAELARRTLDAREARARRAAERDDERQREEPGPARWPHREPGYQPPQREEPRPERTAAQLAAEGFPAGMRPSPRREAPEAEPRAPRPRPREPERDDLERSP
jgi:hypothetical protein